MQPQENLTTNRRALDIEDYIDILRRHKAWILGPVFAALVVSVVVAFLWPDTYVSVAVIRVVPPQVPETLVASNNNGDLPGRRACLGLRTERRLPLGLDSLVSHDVFRLQGQRPPGEGRRIAPSLHTP